jgi:molybdate transport system ATP-binding protein
LTFGDLKVMSTQDVKNVEGTVDATLTVDIEKRYRDGTTIAAAFELPSKPPRVSILFGPSGAGKTTLLRCIAGLETPTRGGIQYGEEIWSQSGTRHWVRPQKRPIGYLFQDFALFPHFTVRRNIGFGLGSLPRDARRRKVDVISSRLGLEALAERRPGELSGGEQQRVALARVLVREPRMLLLDEPFAALDERTRASVRSYLRKFLSQLEIPALVVTHDWIDALVLGDEMMVLSRGRLLQRGSPQEVLTRPAEREVADAVGVDTVAPGRIAERDGGVVRLRVGTAELVAVDPGSGESSFWVCIRGEDVTLEQGPAPRSSARNHLSGQVGDLIPQGTLTKVVLDVGFELVALVTRQAALDLDLAPGVPVSAVFKASIVHLIARTST